MSPLDLLVIEVDMEEVTHDPEHKVLLAIEVANPPNPVGVLHHDDTNVIQNIYVKEEYRRQGVARTLIEAATFGTDDKLLHDNRLSDDGASLVRALGIRLENPDLPPERIDASTALSGKRLLGYASDAFFSQTRGQCYLQPCEECDNSVLVLIATPRPTTCKEHS